MATSNDFFEYTQEKLSKYDVTYKKMMGEYLVYHKGVLIGGVYDNRLLVKKTVVLDKLELTEVLPYVGAKTPKYEIDLDNKKILDIVFLNGEDK